MLKQSVLVTLVFACTNLLVAQAPTNPPSSQQPPTGIAPPDLNAPPAKAPGNVVPGAVDRQFVTSAAIGGMTEVELGKLAAERGGSDAVKQFGQKMVDDHSKAGADLKQLASAKNVSLPASLDSRQKARIKKLSRLSGVSFDKAYIQDQLVDHQQDVTQFEQEAANGSDPAVKEFAAKTLPILRVHLTMITELSSRTVPAAK